MSEGIRREKIEVFIIIVLKEKMSSSKTLPKELMHFKAQVSGDGDIYIKKIKNKKKLNAGKLVR